MTTNQVNYWRNVEAERNNRAVEAETKRSNMTKESETMRANLAKEKEIARTNRVNERINRTKAVADVVKAGAALLI